ncbi:MAG: DUF5678 domain-containing protein [Candidatus Omnitrophota bacterium]
MVQTLIKDNSYNGKYVALKDFNDSTVISDGATPQEAYEKAIQKGYSHPVLIFVPQKDMVQIY